MRFQRSFARTAVSTALAALFTCAPPSFAASHREAPITALDQKADITDWYAFLNPERPNRVVLILNVDPFLEPSNGPNYFPFDPGIRYQMEIDNNRDGVPDVTFEFRFQTQVTNNSVFTGYVGGLAGIPPITSLTGPGAQGINLLQSYNVTMVRGKQRESLNFGQTLYAVPSNVGPRTMPDYEALRKQGTYTLANGVRVFAGTVADPFFIDLGATFDSLNFRKAAGGGVMSAAADADDKHNYAPNALAGFNVNTIALEVPISMLTEDGGFHTANEKSAVIGTWGATYRRKQTVLRGPGGAGDGNWAQVQRLGNPLINEAIIGTGSKDRFSTDEPVNDAQFAKFFLNPLLGPVFASIGIPVPAAPRTDLLPLVQYMAPICPGCGPKDGGPVADMLRLNTGIFPTAAGSQKRLGFLAGDSAGFPNGRRPVDDVFDIAVRVVGGILADGTKYNTPIGDGVNTSSAPLPTSFPFVGAAYSGRNSTHAGPGQAGCTNQPDGICPSN